MNQSRATSQIPTKLPAALAMLLRFVPTSFRLSLTVKIKEWGISGSVRRDLSWPLEGHRLKSLSGPHMVWTGGWRGASLPPMHCQSDPKQSTEPPTAWGAHRHPHPDTTSLKYIFFFLKCAAPPPWLGKGKGLAEGNTDNEQSSPQHQHTGYHKQYVSIVNCHKSEQHLWSLVANWFVLFTIYQKYRDVQSMHSYSVFIHNTVTVCMTCCFSVLPLNLSLTAAGTDRMLWHCSYSESQSRSNHDQAAVSWQIAVITHKSE